ARDSYPAQGAEGRLASLRAELLPAVPSRRQARRAGRHIDEPRRLSLRGARRSGLSRGATASARPFRVEDDEVVFPEPLEELAALVIAHRCQSENVSDVALAVDRPDGPLLVRIDEEREVRIRVARIDEDCGDAARRAVLDRQGPGQSHRDEVAPGLALECDW